MPQELKWSAPRARQVPALIPLLFVVAVLVVFTFSSWRMLQLLAASKEEDLARRLRGVSQVIALSLQQSDPPAILQETATQPAEVQTERLADFLESSDYDAIAGRLAALKAATGLNQVLLLSVHGHVVADSNYRYSPGEPFPFVIDQQFVQDALIGRPATTRLYDWEGEKFQRDYKVVLDETSRRPVGLIMCSISADYLVSMEQVRAQVIRLWTISSVMLLALGFWLYHLFRYASSLERRAMQGARVEAMGALAGGLAHELRNPLAIIRALSEEIEAEQPAGSRTGHNARDIVAETQRLGDLVSHFLSLSRPPEAGAGQPVDLTAEVVRVVQLMRKGAPETLSFELDLPVDSYFIRSEERALRQLLLNILINAREAVSDEGGRVEVQLRARRGQAELRVRDNGPGIPEKHRGRIFEPFYTTKPNGTGLGLAISRSIADNMEGRLTIESSGATGGAGGGRGTTLLLTLPLANP